MCLETLLLHQELHEELPTIDEPSKPRSLDLALKDLQATRKMAEHHLLNLCLTMMTTRDDDGGSIGSPV